MIESFLLPWTMVAGGVLVSAPILIHLINRMRFKRVRWAAMEFLLKSQKRNRRRLIIEQLILLLMRISLVLLTALLVARFVFAFGFGAQQNTLHIVLLDDTASASDQWKEEGDARDSFTLAKKLVVDKIIKNAALANTPHSLELVCLSKLDEAFSEDRLNTESAENARKFLENKQCTALHIDLLRGIEKAQQIFNDKTQERRILHIVSDFRQRDWGSADADGLRNAFTGLAQGKVRVRLLDVAHPYRNETQKIAPYHDNLAVTDLRPETRVAARSTFVQFSVTVANFSASEKKNVRLTIKINGSERSDASKTLMSVPPGNTTETFEVFFDQLGFNQITANLENEEAGLLIDNTRYAVVEVRDKVPLLVIDGDPGNSTKPGGDTYHIQTVFDNVKGAAKGYDLMLRGVTELEQPNLDQYPSIYLLNVREFSDKALQNLETYVREGGSIAFFLGDRVSSDFYNRKLYNSGKGLFPAPLAGRPYPQLSDEEMKPQLGDQYQIYLRSKTHPMLASVYEHRDVFRYLPIKRYFPVVRAKWNPERGRVEELVTLPNNKSIDDYKDAAQVLIDKLPIKDPAYQRYSKQLENHRQAIRRVLSGGEPLYKLANALEALLQDRGDKNKPEERPDLAEFWGQPEVQRLRDEIEKFRETVQYGDPLVIASRFGKGKVVAFLTTAGQKWNHWAGGVEPPFVAATYPMVMIETQKYLTSLSNEANLSVGSPLEIQLDGTRYDGAVRRFYQPEPKDGAAGGPGKANLVDLGKANGVLSKDNRLTFEFSEALKPGIYLFQIAPRGEGLGVEGKPEQRAFAFNVDAQAESDLRRATKDDFESIAPGASILSLDSSDADLADRQPDLSETPWLYLIFLIILICEQALAVHLSFHLRGNETPAGSTAAPQPTTA